MEKIEKVKQGNRYLYSILLRNIEKPKSENKWVQVMGESNVNNNWKEIYAVIYKASNDSSIRSFQYKFLLRILPTNKQLLKQGIVSSSLCTFCNSNIESLEHLFWECIEVQPLWNSLNNFIAARSINLKIKKQEVMFGILTNNEHVNICNFLIILAKYYIFASKYRNNKPNFNAYKEYLRLRIKIEEQIALNNDRHNAHQMKWRPFINYV